MTTWQAYGQIEERPQLVWDRSRWIMPVPWEGLVLIPFLVWMVPGAAYTLLGAERSLPLVVLVGFVWAWVAMHINWRVRLKRRTQLAATLQATSFVCANCLHAED